MSIELQKYKGKATRHDCPACGRKDSFVLYIDTDTNQPINAKVGKCNRESNCGYHYSPKQYFIDYPTDKGEQRSWIPSAHRQAEPPKAIGSLNPDLVLKSYSTESNFVRFLIDLFNDKTKAIQLCQNYKLGATKAKEVIFWQIDLNGFIRTGKIMQYDPTSGKRKHVDWTHSRMIKAGQLPTEYNLKQCFFGEHLLKSKPSAAVAIVESEKTAIIASGLMPDFVWIAAGQLQGLNIDKCKVLAGRNVVLFPDLSIKQPNRMNAFEVWSAKATEIMRAHKCKIIVSDLLERKATDPDRQSGFDIADYLIRELKQNEPPRPKPAPRMEIEPTPTKETEKQKDIQPDKRPQIKIDWSSKVDELDTIKGAKFKVSDLLEREASQAERANGCDIAEPIYKPQPQQNWIVEISELESYFAAVEIPNQPLRLNQCSMIIDVPLFIESHLSTLKANNGQSIFLPHLNRLQTLKQIIKNQKS